jgi:hypothetical protein
MKKLTTLAMIAILMLTAVFAVMQSGTAMAANGAADVSVTVRNLTGGTVSLRLTAEGNDSFWFTFEGQGMYNISVPEGRYSFYASTPCGGESGEFNLNVHKIMKFYCEDGADVTLTKPEAACGLYAWFHGPGQFWGHWHPEEDTSRMPAWDVPSNWELRCTDGDPTFGFPT